jgi:hypothetical protein
MKQVTNEIAKQRVIDTLRKLSQKFPSADKLAEAVKELGLFDGKVYFNNGKWELSDKRLYKPHYSEINNNPIFGAINQYGIYGQWICQIGFGVHYVQLIFSMTTGELFEVLPDKKKGFWKDDNPEERIREIYNLLGFKYHTREEIKEELYKKRWSKQCERAYRFIKSLPLKADALIDIIESSDYHYMQRRNREQYAYDWNRIGCEKYRYVYIIAYRPDTPHEIR